MPHRDGVARRRGRPPTRRPRGRGPSRRQRGGPPPLARGRPPLAEEADEGEDRDHRHEEDAGELRGEARAERRARRGPEREGALLERERDTGRASPKKPSAAARSVWTTPACATRFGSKATSAAASSPATLPPQRRTRAADDEDEDEEERRRRARARRRRGAPAGASEPRRRTAAAARPCASRRARPCAAGATPAARTAKPDEELHERRVLEVRVVRSRDRVLGRRERVERLVHRRAVVARVVRHERARRGPRASTTPSQNRSGPGCAHPADCRGGAPRGGLLPSRRGASARAAAAGTGSSCSSSSSPRSRLRLAPFPDATARGLAAPLARLLRPPPAHGLGRAQLPARPVPRSVPEPPRRRRLHLAARLRPPRGRHLARAVSAVRARRSRSPRVAATLPAVLGALQVVPLFFLARRRVRAPPRPDRRRRVRRDPGRGPLGRLRALRPPRRRGAQPPPRPRGRGAGGRRAAGARGSCARPSSAPRSRSRSSRGRAPSSSRASASPGPPSPSERARAPPPSRPPSSSRPGPRLDAPEGAGPVRVRLLRLVPAGAPRAAPPVPLLALAAWRAPSRAPARSSGRSAAAVALAVALPRARRVLEAVVRGGAYVFKEGAGRARGRLRRRRLPLLPARVPAPRRREPAARPPAGPPSSARCASSPRASFSSRSRSSPGSGPAARRPVRSRSRPRAAAPRPRRALRRRRPRHGALPAAQRLLPLDLRGARPRRRRRAPRAAPAARAARAPWRLSPLAAGLVVVPGAPYLAARLHVRGRPGYDVLDLFARLRALDPPPVDPAALPPPAPGSIPGVMPPWSAGHFVTAIAGRPSAADPFLYGWRRQCRLFTATDDAEALAILRAREVPLPRDDRPDAAPARVRGRRGPRARARRRDVRAPRTRVRRREARPVPRPRPRLAHGLASCPDGRFLPRFRVFRVESP